jgi:ABC-type antimicrobial peptide transport system permease subunit
MRRSLTVAQVALSLVLLSTGGLVVRSFERLLSADPGFKTDGVLTMLIGLPTWLFAEARDSYGFQDRVDAAIRALPGVTAVGATTSLPLSGGTNVSTISVNGGPGSTGDEKRDQAVVDRIFVRAGYAEAIGMRLIAGRAFEERREGVREAMIDRSLALRLFPNRSALGAMLRTDGVSVTIIGVVDQARLYDLHRDGRPQLFVRADDYDDAGRRPVFLAVRTSRDPESMIAEVRSVIRRIDRRVLVVDERPMAQIVANKRSRERISAVVIGGLALGALLLVAMGLFGVIAGSVARRRGEMAVRMALAATQHRVIRLVVAEGARLLALGFLTGVPGIYLSGQTIRALLIDVSPFDAPTLAAVAAGLTFIALLTCYLAARKITSIEPANLHRAG